MAVAVGGGEEAGGDEDLGTQFWLVRALSRLSRSSTLRLVDEGGAAAGVLRLLGANIVGVLGAGAAGFRCSFTRA